MIDDSVATIVVAILGLMAAVATGFFANRTAKKRADREAEAAVGANENTLMQTMSEHLQRLEESLKETNTKVDVLEKKLGHFSLQILHAKRFITQLEFQVMDLKEEPLPRPSKVQEMFED